MSKRLIVILTLLAVVVAGAAWLHFELPNHAWAYKLNGEWYRTEEGWSLLLSAWPVALAGAVIGGAVLLLLFGSAYFRGFEADTEHELNAMAIRLDNAEKRAESATIRAEERLEEDREALKNKAEAVAQALQKSERLKQEAVNYYNSAKEQVGEAEAKAAEAEQRRQNATATAERYRRKVKRLSGASEGS
jgi:hypothetical protein